MQPNRYALNTRVGIQRAHEVTEIDGPTTIIDNGCATDTTTRAWIRDNRILEECLSMEGTRPPVKMTTVMGRSPAVEKVVWCPMRIELHKVGNGQDWRTAPLIEDGYLGLDRHVSVIESDEVVPPLFPNNVLNNMGAVFCHRSGRLLIPTPRGDRVVQWKMSSAGMWHMPYKTYKPDQMDLFEAERTGRVVRKHNTWVRVRRQGPNRGRHAFGQRAGGQAAGSTISVPTSNRFEPLREQING
jgi:hypothetical protein